MLVSVLCRPTYPYRGRRQLGLVREHGHAGPRGLRLQLALQRPPVAQHGIHGGREERALPVAAAGRQKRVLADGLSSGRRRRVSPLSARQHDAAVAQQVVPRAVVEVPTPLRHLLSAAGRLGGLQERDGERDRRQRRGEYVHRASGVFMNGCPGEDGSFRRGEKK